MTTTNNNKPIETFRIGSVKATIWTNSGQNGTYHSIEISRTYKNENGDYEDTNRFSQLELLAVAKVAEQAAEHIQSLAA